MKFQHTTTNELIEISTHHYQWTHWNFNTPLPMTHWNFNTPLPMNLSKFQHTTTIELIEISTHRYQWTHWNFNTLLPMNSLKLQQYKPVEVSMIIQAWISIIYVPKLLKFQQHYIKKLIEISIKPNVLKFQTYEISTLSCEMKTVTEMTIRCFFFLCQMSSPNSAFWRVAMSSFLGMITSKWKGNF